MDETRRVWSDYETHQALRSPHLPTAALPLATPCCSELRVQVFQDGWPGSCMLIGRCLIDEASMLELHSSDPEKPPRVRLALRPSTSLELVLRFEEKRNVDARRFAPSASSAHTNASKR